ncbi:MAG TPA: aspartate aminotransferase family protein [Chitinophagales bacterium]
MKTFDVYPLVDIEPVRGEGIYLYDKNGTRYTDMYGGHAVISIGHSHPHYVRKITEQVQKIGFYSNSVQIPQQQELAQKLGALSGYENYALFLVNSGAEANENALKLASFKTGKKKIIAFHKSFHGRTSLAVAATDDKNIQAPINENPNIVFLPLNDEKILTENFNDEIAAVIVEGIQGVGGVHIPTKEFLHHIKQLCAKHNAIFIVDEIQSGYGRSGKFFAHQHSDIQPDIITIAKGMGNGFPVAGTLISPAFEAKYGQLGTTFGGNHLACAAAIAVLDVIKEENLIANAESVGAYMIEELKKISSIKEIRGQGLMIAVEMHEPIANLRTRLLQEQHVFTGTASNKNVLRILPPLCITREQATEFLEQFNAVLK